MRFILPLAITLAALASGCVVDVNYPFYDRCFATSDCDASAENCFFVTYDDGVYSDTKGMCSATCGSDAECPVGTDGEVGGCYDVAGSGAFLCYERCLSDLDCDIGFSCIRTSAGDDICLPR